ncbi:MAG: aldose epimerase family protein [Bacteroidota bacterium]
MFTTLRNTLGMEAKLSHYGGSLSSLRVPTNSGDVIDVVLGFAKEEDYLSNPSSMGVLVGRYGNRIAHGKFHLDGQAYQLATNLREHHLHGGSMGFQRRYWQILPTSSANQLILAHESTDGEDGYPGHLSVQVSFRLTDDMGFRIEYEARTQAPTVINLTHHAYFNLAGSGHVLDHELWLNSDQTTRVDPSLIPTGEFADVQGTVFDFRTPKLIGKDIHAPDPQLQYGSGYDHNYVLNDWDGNFRHFATVKEFSKGLVMKCFTTEPGVQFYSANHLRDTRGKGGVNYEPFSGFCLEAQHYPDSPNHPHFPSTVLRPGETYRQTTEYRFEHQ